MNDSAGERPDPYWNWQDESRRLALAAYLCPEHELIRGLVAAASEDLGELTGDGTFHSYVAGKPDRTRQEAEALYRRLQKMEPREGPLGRLYHEPLAPPGVVRIRPIDEVLLCGWGDSLEWALVFAACLQSVCIHSLLGHRSRTCRGASQRIRRHCEGACWILGISG